MWTRLLPALRIVPRHVKWRVARIVATLIVLASAALAALWHGLPPSLASLRLPLAICGLLWAAYALWCLWPRLRLGIAPELLADLPCPTGQRVRLSFDDGPTPALTDRVLDLLFEHGVQAAFFVLTHKARRCPDLVRRIVAEGHILGLHGEDHRTALFRSQRELRASLARARDELSALSGQPISLYRPSHGWKNRALLSALRRCGLRLVFWDHGVWDTDAPPVDVLLKRLQLATPAPGEAGPAPVILLHDGRDDRTTLPSHSPALLAALSAWLPSLNAQPSRKPPQPQTSDKVRVMAKEGFNQKIINP